MSCNLLVSVLLPSIHAILSASSFPSSVLSVYNNWRILAMEPNNRVFQSDMETIEEFLERWKVHNYDVLSKLKTDGTDDTKKVMLLVRALSVEVTTDIQRKF